MDTQPATATTEPNLLRQQFPVLIVFAVFVLMLGVYIMEIHWSGDATITTWLQNKMSDLIAAMLMGLTGAVASRNGAK